ncbi:MAG: DEAD/DEAH box helicase [Fibrobacter sp.]|nr:DEAD/DEAH box helicase [Fibrobacter sp.]
MQDKPLQYFVIRSPYAQLLLTGVKTFEFRSNAKIFANKRLAISVSKTPGAEMMLEQEFKYWEKQLNKSLKKSSDDERETALATFQKACVKAKKLFEKTNGNGMIIGEVETGDASDFDSGFGVPILSFKLWSESEWINSPGGLGVRYMPGVKHPETEPNFDYTKAYKTPFSRILDKYREASISERDKGNKFELLMQRFLQTDPVFSSKLETVWLWNDFFAKEQFGGKDVGVDLVAKTIEGNYWAIQCKCYKADKKIDKPAVDTFLATSGKVFTDEEGKKIHFAYRLWLDTTENGFNQEALNSTKNQDPEFHRFGLIDLENSLVDWEKLDKGLSGDNARVRKKSPRDHQKEAIKKVHEYFSDGTHDRGKLIMACGTGKTYTSLCIAEKETEGKGTILFLVPSIALLGQTLREWSADATDKIKPICICSDAGVSKKSSNDVEGDGYSVEELALPASTNVPSIVKQLEIAQYKKGGMTVVFSTYQSIDVISEAQKKMGSDFIFDMIICDEAHRTTGAVLSGREESNFVKVHDSKFLRAKKRIYMTATPRLYSESSKKKAEEGSVLLCSMDDEKLYGEEMYRIGFGEAVDKQLLSDYKVLVLTIDPKAMSDSLQTSLATDSGEMLTDDEAKLIGCFNALSKITLVDDHQLKETDPQPMHRAVAFSQTIKISKELVETINDLRDSYYDELKPEAKSQMVRVSAKHIDGGMNASLRDEKLRWLKADMDENECRILNNVRCLSEGVDVPSLDAVLFLSARDSEVDVVQSVGRVMRTAPGKKYGYIIIPVIVPASEKAEDALDNNDRFKVVWKILNALRAHDDRFNAMVNKIQFNTPIKGKSRTGGRVGVSDGLNHGTDTENLTPEQKEKQQELQDQLELKFQELQGAIYAKMVEKVGSRRYWEQWAQDVARIAQRHEERIKRLIATEGKHQKAFKGFISALQKNINPSITEQKAIETLSQHLITKPVFDALFEGYDFAKNNPVSRAMQRVINLLEEQTDEEDVRSLEKFYKSVKLRAEGVENAEGKQKIIIELYDKFFKTALPKTVEQLGIVYTPVECVDFIIHSVNDVLRQEFGRKLSDENVNIIDPFAGTGTFMTRLIQSGLIGKKDLERKYEKELKANEIVLLAYYIASVNIENAYHDAVDASEYKPFEGICLTDTFQLSEKRTQEDFGEEFFPVNGPRARAQRKVPIQVVIGNPPYSVGQKSANDNAQNQKYPDLDSRVDLTYAQNSTATNKNSLYDSYIKAFRWATDRLDPKNGGVIGFITNGNWIDGNAMEGFRKSLENEFSKIYVYNLRGNQRTSGELSRKEGGKIFGSGSRTPVAITILVKQPTGCHPERSASGIEGSKKAIIKYFDIGDYLTREQKLAKIKEAESITHLEMSIIHPNEHGDWINLRNESFGKWIPIEPEKKFDENSKSWFVVNSRGFETSRDSWVYASSKQTLDKNIATISKEYNLNLGRKKDDLNFDPSKISWSSSLISDVKNRKPLSNYTYRESVYRPYFKQNVYFGDTFIHRMGQMKAFFPSEVHENRIICISGLGGNKQNTALISNHITDLNCLDAGTQCFPLYYYEELDSSDMFATNEKYVRKDAVSDYILKQARTQYNDPKIRKEDIFYYVYGFLHCEEYRTEFSADLKKMLPRIPLVDTVADFWSFSKAGRELAEIHLNYEQAEPYKALVISSNSTSADLPMFSGMAADIHPLYSATPADNLYKVKQMRFAKTAGLDRNGKAKNIDDKTRIIYNEKITIANIPTEAYEYIVNGKSAIEWIMERYAVTTDKASGIVNDPNDWALEHNDPKYIFNLLLRIITVSLNTMKIVKALPKVKF